MRTLGSTVCVCEYFVIRFRRASASLLLGFWNGVAVATDGGRRLGGGFWFGGLVVWLFGGFVVVWFGGGGDCPWNCVS